MKRFKKFLAMMLALVMVFSMLPVSALAADNAAFTVSSVAGKAGEEVTVSVDVSENPGFWMAQWKVSYDTTRLEKVEYTMATIDGVDLSNKNDNFLWENDADADIQYAGKVLDLKFRIKEDAPVGDAEVTITNLLACNFDEQAVEFDVVAGKVTVEPEAACPIVFVANGQTLTPKKTGSETCGKFSGAIEIYSLEVPSTAETLNISAGGNTIGIYRSDNATSSHKTVKKSCTSYDFKTSLIGNVNYNVVCIEDTSTGSVYHFNMSLVTPPTVAVTGISLDQETLTMDPEQTATLVATVSPADATDKTVTWTSSNPYVATVANGVVTAVAGGTTTITAQAGEYTATCDVTVEFPFTIVFTANGQSLTPVKTGAETCANDSVNCSTYTLEVPNTVSTVNITAGGSTMRLLHCDRAAAPHAAITDPCTSYDFTTSLLNNPQFRVICIQDTSTGGVFHIYMSLVEPPVVNVTGVTLDKDTLALKTGETGTLVATVSPDDATDKSVTWTSTNSEVATVADGVVTAVAAGEATITAKAAEFTATCVVTVTQPASGYTFATSADVSAENGGTATVHVKITGHSDPSITTYNAYDLTLTYDNTKLEFVSGEGADSGDQIKIEKKGDNQIQIVGVGDAKRFDVEVATLTFRTLAEGSANITIDKVQISDKETAVDDNIPEATPKHEATDPEADETPSVSVIVVPYSVNKPDFISGNDKVVHGDNYTFSYTDTDNYTYSGLTVTVNGETVEPTLADGIYTIANVTGAVVIDATQTANTYNVIKPANVIGSNEATYDVDYKFTVTPAAGMAIASVKVTKTNDATVEIPYTINENGEYVIAGTNITADFTITVTEKEKMTTITFNGIEATEIEGGKLTVAAEIGKDFTFKLIKAAAYTYTVKVGETELSESTTTAGQYTIPADLVVAGGVAVNITKADSSKVTVDVHEFIKLDGKVMFLVTAKWRDKVLAYGEGNTMIYSPKYTVTGYDEAGAYCWLVVSTDEMNTVELVKAAAEAAIVAAAEGTTVTAVKYNYDINGTTWVDVNDAQLAYDMYNASYMEFTENLPMLKFLEADMSTNMKLDVNDVAAVINYIVSGAAN